MMKIFQALEAEYSAICLLNSDVSGIKFGANMFLSLQLTPALYYLLQSFNFAAGRQSFMLAAAASLTFVCITMYFLRKKNQNDGCIKKIDLRGRLIFSFFLFSVPVVVIVASRISPFIGIAVYLLLISMPLQSWISSRNP
jgi:hypothetical protein